MPSNAVRDEDHDELGAALALRRRAPLVGDARAAEHGDVDLPAVVDALQVPLKLAPVDGGGHLHGADCPVADAAGATLIQYLAIAGDHLTRAAGYAVQLPGPSIISANAST